MWGNSLPAKQPEDIFFVLGVARLSDLDRTGSAANLLLDGDSGTQTIDHLDVKDSDAGGGATLVCNQYTEFCVDSYLKERILHEARPL